MVPVCANECRTLDSADGESSGMKTLVETSKAILDVLHTNAQPRDFRPRNMLITCTQQS